MIRKNVVVTSNNKSFDLFKVENQLYNRFRHFHGHIHINIDLQLPDIGKMFIHYSILLSETVDYEVTEVIAHENNKNYILNIIASDILKIYIDNLTKDLSDYEKMNLFLDFAKELDNE